MVAEQKAPLVGAFCYLPKRSTLMGIGVQGSNLCKLIGPFFVFRNLSVDVETH